MVLYFQQKKKVTLNNMLKNFIYKEISALAKYSVNSGGLWTAGTKTPSLADPKVAMAFTDHSLCHMFKKKLQHDHLLAELPL